MFRRQRGQNYALEELHAAPAAEEVVPFLCGCAPPFATDGIRHVAGHPS